MSRVSLLHSVRFHDVQARLLVEHSVRTSRSKNQRKQPGPVATYMIWVWRAPVRPIQKTRGTQRNDARLVPPPMTRLPQHRASLRRLLCATRPGRDRPRHRSRAWPRQRGWRGTRRIRLPLGVPHRRGPRSRGARRDHPPRSSDPVRWSVVGTMRAVDDGMVRAFYETG